ncbi:MAG: hypothetical protein QXV08_08840 [Desulfurococcus sp.]|uniref:hypothetical protein n=1 Tax=Desulfurococcus sp. TaxID=51678 RepID=UPI00317674A7
MSDLFAKIRRVFGEYAVDKSLLQVAEISRLPGFVAEYLMAEFSQMYPSDWQEKLRENDEIEWVFENGTVYIRKARGEQSG